MASYRIVCTKQVPIAEPTIHAHIVEVGYTDNFYENNGKYKKTLMEIIKAMDNGNKFFTLENNHKAEVEKFFCHLCNRLCIRTKPDFFSSNNLDSLRKCNWNN